MRYLFLSFLTVCLFGFLIIPNAFTENDADEQWGTIFIEKPILEIIHTSDWKAQYEKIKIFGTVEEPRSATWIYLTITEPGDKTSEVTAIASSDGTYESYTLVCCNKIGKYTVSGEWKGHHIGTVTFDVIMKDQYIEKPPSEPELLVQESIKKIPDWVRDIFIWYAEDRISENALLDAIKFLANQGIIILDE